MSEIKVNINEYIKVRLTAYGIDVLTQYFLKNFESIGSEDKRLAYMESRFEGDLLKMQMWEFFSIFAEHLYNGCEAVIFKNEIRINE